MSVLAGAGAGAGLTRQSQSGHGAALTGGSCTTDKVVGAAAAGGPLRVPCTQGFTPGVCEVIGFWHLVTDPQLTILI